MGFFSFLDPILEPIIDIVKGFIMLFEFIFFLVTQIPVLIETAMEIFNPTNLLNDIIGGTIAAFTLIGKRIMDLVNPRTYFGSDPNIDPGKQEDIFGAKPEKDPTTGKYNSPHKSKGKKCLPPTMARMVLLMLCPPFALFLHLGLMGWVSIIICSLLTVYGFYFPGLIYATLHILC